MFRGYSFHSIDAKGRLIIPTRFREELKGEGGIMVSRMDKSLFAYTYGAWSRIEDKLMSLTEVSEYMRRFRRVFIGSAHDLNLDKQSRILIPPPLRDYAELEKETVLVGALDHFEIWSRKNWDIENERLEEDLKHEEVRSEIAKLGL